MTAPQPVIATHASSAGGNWYDQHGNQIASVPKKDGAPTRPTLAHARKLDLAPGVTTIIGMADKPALTAWKMKRAAEAGRLRWNHPGGSGGHDEDTEGSEHRAWLSNCLELAGEIGAKAAEQGTNIHAAIQRSYQGHEFGQTYAPHVQGVRQLLLDVSPNAGWKTEFACVSKLGYGTKADLCSYEWVVDFKGKDLGPDDIAGLEIYDEHHMQLAATRMALADHVGQGYETARCAIVYVSRTVPGLVHMIESKRDELARGWEMFKTLHEFWCVKNRYRPSWATKE